MHSIDVPIDLSRGILVQAKGQPAKVVSHGAAAAVVGGVRGWLAARKTGNETTHG